MVRASHTLCGIHRAGGFPLIALTAGPLEQCLLALQPLPLPLPTEALPALADAIGGLGEFLGRVKERRSFNATDVAIAAEIQQELDAVRQMASSLPMRETRLPPEIALADAELPTPAEDVDGELDRRAIERESRSGNLAGSGGRGRRGSGVRSRDEAVAEPTPAPEFEPASRTASP